MTMITQKDVAKAVGVSRSLVSKVLNDNLGTTQVGPDLIERIQATAEQLGYRKNISALNLKSQRHGVIAVAMCLPGTFTSGIGMRILSALTEFSENMDVRLDMRFYAGPDGFAATAEELTSSRADALVVIGVLPKNAKEILEGKQKQGMPVVTVFNRPCSPLVPNIDINFADAARQVEELFASCRCQRVLVAPTGSPFVKLLRHEFKAPFFIPAKDSYEEHLNGYEYANGEAWAEQIMASGLEFDGVFASSDEHAAAFIQVLQSHGKHVPTDVVVVGINDSGWGKFWPTPIASINAKYNARVTLALQMAQAIINKQEIGATEVTIDIINRESCKR